MRYYCYLKPNGYDGELPLACKPAKTLDEAEHKLERICKINRYQGQGRIRDIAGTLIRTVAV